MHGEKLKLIAKV